MKVKVDMEGNLPSVIKHLSASKESLTLHNIVINNGEAVSVESVEIDNNYHQNNENEDEITTPLKPKEDEVLIKKEENDQETEEEETEKEETEEEVEVEKVSTIKLESEKEKEEKEKEKEEKESKKNEDNSVTEEEKGKEKVKYVEEVERSAKNDTMTTVATEFTSSSPSPASEELDQSSKKDHIKCMICLDHYPKSECVTLTCNDHMLCETCVEGYITSQIMGEGRVEILCPEPECKKVIDDELIKKVLPAEVYSKYQSFALKKFLRTQKNVHFCPAPNCDYAVIMKRSEVFGYNIGSCDGNKSKIVCKNDTCKTEFCFHCGEVWHPDLTCEQNKTLLQISGGELIQQENTKPCPKCNVPIFKLQDGTCNHMECTSCGTHFCWLCMREINDMHFFSPTGCTFFADEKMSTSKRTALQVTLVVGAPLFISVIGAISVPAIMVAVPVQTYKKIKKIYPTDSGKRKLAMALGLPASIVLSPLIAGIAVGFGIPLMLVGAYIVIPGYLIYEARKNKQLENERKKRALQQTPDASTSVS